MSISIRVNLSYIANFVLLIGSLALLSSCQQAWYLSVEATDDLTNVEICVSTRPNCGGDGVGMPRFTIAESDDQGIWTNDDGIIQPMWSIVPVQRGRLHRFSYGVGPDGWAEASPMLGLELDTWYVAEGHFFRFQTEAGRVVSEVVSHRDFHSKLQREK